MSSVSTQATRAGETEPWTTRRLLGWMTTRFGEAGVESPRVVSEMLIAHVMSCERLHLYMDVDRRATDTERRRLRDLVGRAVLHEPVQYLVGEAWFFSRPFTVGPSVLVPRQCTEMLIEHLTQWWRGESGTLRVADIGTGSGCIAVSIAAQFPDATVVATDVSSEALDVAHGNATRHGVSERIGFFEGDGLEALEKAGYDGFDAIVTNPPYIPDAEWEDVPDNVRLHEPSDALRGGHDGLDVARPIIRGAARYLRPSGRLLMEVGHSAREAVLRVVAESDGLTGGEVHRDHEGLWRLLTASRQHS